jgi:hypothetical protein
VDGTSATASTATRVAARRLMMAPSATKSPAAKPEVVAATAASCQRRSDDSPAVPLPISCMGKKREAGKAEEAAKWTAGGAGVGGEGL